MKNTNKLTFRHQAGFNRLLALWLMPAMLTLFAGSYAEEQRPENLEAVPDAPEASDPIQSGEAIEPEITIIRKDNATIEEYRANGKLYMVKIVPVAGPPYYLVDRDGDGELESRVNDIREDINIPQWVLFEW